MSRPNDTDNFFDESEDSADPQLTELVAYLDGELDEDESRRLERQLSGNAPLRGYAETLDRTWQLLDALGEATASGEFTQKTISSLSAIASDDTDPATHRAWSGFLNSVKAPAVSGLLWALAGFAGCSAGLLLSRAGQQQKPESEDVQILHQLELLEYFPGIYPVQDADFLQKISTLNSSIESEEKP